MKKVLIRKTRLRKRLKDKLIELSEGYMENQLSPSVVFFTGHEPVEFMNILVQNSISFEYISEKG